jgi:hypothetical protein
MTAAAQYMTLYRMKHLLKFWRDFRTADHSFAVLRGLRLHQQSPCGRWRWSIRWHVQVIYAPVRMSFLGHWLRRAARDVGQCGGGRLGARAVMGAASLAGRPTEAASSSARETLPRVAPETPLLLEGFELRPPGIVWFLDVRVAVSCRAHPAVVYARISRWVIGFVTHPLCEAGLRSFRLAL